MIKLIRHNQAKLDGWYFYEMAGQLVASIEAIKALEAFQFDGSLVQSSHDLGLESKKFELFDNTNSECKFKELVVFNNNVCEVSLLKPKPEFRAVGSRADVAQINIAGQPVCHLDLENNLIIILNNDSFDNNFNLELITGPALMLLLAENHVFSLHAGAVRLTLPNSQKRNVAFIAESGVGKSTLSLSAGSNWEQVSDDILPLMVTKGVRFFEYPQLKLQSNFIENKINDNNRLNFIFNLNSNFVDDVFITKMKPVESLLGVVRHTVAATLFDHEIMQMHMLFAKKIIDQVGVYQVSYPREIQQLPKLRKEIINFLAF